MSAPRLLALAAALLVAGGCSSAPTKEEGPRRPVRFAVVAAPEVGKDDDALALAVGKLSREPDLDFVLVPGPLLAKDADATSLELLKNDLGQLAPPVYVGFAAAVGSASPALKAEEILAALEKMGPGEEHAVSYLRSPPRQANVLVSVAGPDGKSRLEAHPEGSRVIQLGPGDPRAELAVLVGAKTGLAKGEGAPRWATITVAPLAASRTFVVATLYPNHLEVQPVALEGTDSRAPFVLDDFEKR